MINFAEFLDYKRKVDAEQQTISLMAVSIINAASAKSLVSPIDAVRQSYTILDMVRREQENRGERQIVEENKRQKGY